MILTRFRAKLQAAIILVALEVSTIFSLFAYKDYITKNREHWDLFSFRFFIAVGIPSLIYLFGFIRDERWKIYVERFEMWPKNKNRRGTWIVIGILVVIIVNLGFFFNLKNPYK